MRSVLKNGSLCAIKGSWGRRALPESKGHAWVGLLQGPCSGNDLPHRPLPTTLRACRSGPFPFAHVLWPFLWVRGAFRLLLLQFSGVQWKRALHIYTSSWFRYLVHDKRRNTVWFAPRDSVVNLFWICDEERKPIFTAVMEFCGVSLPFASSRNFALIDVCKY